jgi:hypothetical protein
MPLSIKDLMRIAGNELLTALSAQDGPGKTLSVTIVPDDTGAIIQCRFARNFDRDACASWLVAKVSAWIRQNGDPAFTLDVTRDLREPTIEARICDEPPLIRVPSATPNG